MVSQYDSRELLSMSIMFVILIGVTLALSRPSSPSSVTKHCRSTVDILRGKRRVECGVVGIKYVHSDLGLLRRPLLRLALVFTQLWIDGVLSTFGRRQRILHRHNRPLLLLYDIRGLVRLNSAITSCTL